MKDETSAKRTASIKEAGETKAGHQAPSRMYEIKPPQIRMVRERLDVSQDEFAVMIGVSTRALQNWETAYTTIVTAYGSSIGRPVEWYSRG